MSNNPPIPGFNQVRYNEAFVKTSSVSFRCITFYTLLYRHGRSNWPTTLRLFVAKDHKTTHPNFISPSLRVNFSESTSEFFKYILFLLASIILKLRVYCKLAQCNVEPTISHLTLYYSVLGPLNSSLCLQFNGLASTPRLCSPRARLSSLIFTNIFQHI